LTKKSLVPFPDRTRPSVVSTPPNGHKKPLSELALRPP